MQEVKLLDHGMFGQAVKWPAHMGDDKKLFICSESSDKRLSLSLCWPIGSNQWWGVLPSQWNTCRLGSRLTGRGRTAPSEGVKWTGWGGRRHFNKAPLSIQRWMCENLGIPSSYTISCIMDPLYRSSPNMIPQTWTKKKSTKKCFHSEQCLNTKREKKHLFRSTLISL